MLRAQIRLGSNLSSTAYSASKCRRDGIRLPPQPWGKRGALILEAGNRPVPRLAPDTEFFWTSGAGGYLWFLQCRQCSHLICPPTPACRHCRARDTIVTKVSGKATVWSCTVAGQQFANWIAAPYVASVVTPGEGPRVRLTAAGCEPEPQPV